MGVTPSTDIEIAQGGHAAHVGTAGWGPEGDLHPAEQGGGPLQVFARVSGVLLFNIAVIKEGESVCVGAVVGHSFARSQKDDSRGEK